MEEQWKKPIQKPIGVYVVTILVFLKFGVLDFINYFLAIRAGNGEVAFHITAIFLGLCVFTAAAAVWAFTGDNAGRIALLVILPMNILWIVLLALTALLNEDQADDKNAVFAIIQMVTLSLIVVGIEWYLMSKKVVEYYKQDLE